MPRPSEKGASLLELLVAVAVLSVIFTVLGTLLVENLKIAKREQTQVEVQSKARNALARVVNTIRSAGWDPGGHGIPTVALDPDTTDDVSQIEVFIDRDGNGVTAGTEWEQVLFRHVGDRIEWRNDGAGGFRLLADGITNDRDGDGIVEPMFIPDSTVDPTTIRVQITAESDDPDPVTGASIRFTAIGEVVFRKAL